MNALIEHDEDLMKPVDGTTMVADLQRAEIDIQVATAHKYPRSLTKVARNVLGLATISKASAEKCMYALPRGGKPITGPSIRLAEIVFSQWGNCRGGARVVQVDKENGFVEAEAVFHDLETNSATTKRVRRRIFDKNGRCFNDDMILVTGNAACSIAFRNAVLGGVPEAIWDEAYQSAMRTMRGDTKTLPERREAALTAMAAFGLTPEQVYQILGIAGEKDFGIDQIVIVGGFHNALKEEETTVEKLLADAGVEAKPKRASGSVVKEKTEANDETAQEQDADEQKAQEILGKYSRLFDTIVADLTDAPSGSDIDEVVSLYGPQVEKMKSEAPELHERLVETIEEFRSEAGAD